jgi:hypothetical protein
VSIYTGYAAAWSQKAGLLEKLGLWKQALAARERALSGGKEKK